MRSTQFSWSISTVASQMHDFGKKKSQQFTVKMWDSKLRFLKDVLILLQPDAWLFKKTQRHLSVENYIRKQ